MVATTIYLHLRVGKISQQIQLYRSKEIEIEIMISTTTNMRTFHPFEHKHTNNHNASIRNRPQYLLLHIAHNLRQPLNKVSVSFVLSLIQKCDLSVQGCEFCHYTVSGCQNCCSRVMNERNIKHSKRKASVARHAKPLSPNNSPMKSLCNITWSSLCHNSTNRHTIA